MPVEHPGPCPPGPEDGTITREQVAWALRMFEWESAQPPRPYVFHYHPEDLDAWRKARECP